MLHSFESYLHLCILNILFQKMQSTSKRVDYHFGLGFHTIYIIDNSKEHELQNWQNKRRNSGYSLRVMPKPGTHRQMYGYHMCAAEYREDHTYMAFFDVDMDEFLVLKKHNTVNDFLEQHLRKGSLAISWFIFGTGFRDAPLPVTKHFSYREGLIKAFSCLMKNLNSLRKVFSTTQHRCLETQPVSQY